MSRFCLLLSISFFLTGCYGPTQVKIDENATTKHRNEKAHISSGEKFMKHMLKTEKSLENYKTEGLRNSNAGYKYKW